MNACPDCGRDDGTHVHDCPQYDVRTELVPIGNQTKALAIISGETMQPDRAQAYVEANVHRMPAEFIMYVAYGRLFMGERRGPAEAQLMDAIMKLLSYNYQVVIEKDDPMMRLALKCKRLWVGGEEIEGHTDDPVLHVCGGMAKHYPYVGGFGPNDETLDLAPETEPDWLQDARDPFPQCPRNMPGGTRWRAKLIDPPYSPPDATHYSPGEAAYPLPNQLIKNALDALPIGGRVGLIHYVLPAQPKNAKFIAAIGIMCGFNNRIRVFSVFEKDNRHRGPRKK